MKKLKIIGMFGAIIMLAGCASTSAIYRNRAGDKLEVQSVRFFWQTEQVRMALQTNGLPEVEINKTKPDSESITASAGAVGTILEAVAKGAAGK